MKKPATVADWRNRPRGAVTDEAAKKAELFAQLESFIRNNGGWLISSPSEKIFRFEAPQDSSLPRKLIEMGWTIRFMGTSVRILPDSVKETFVDHSLPGRPTVTRSFSGLGEVACYEAKP